MRQLPWNDDVAATVASLRALAPAPAEVQEAAATIVADVRARGDAACARRRRGSTAWIWARTTRCPPSRWRRGSRSCRRAARALETAAANIPRLPPA